jgi:hypothetical protein
MSPGIEPAASPLETIPPGEPQAIARVVAVNLKTLDLARRPVPRAQHAKSHGYLWGYLTVESNIPEPYRVGLFRDPGARFPAVVRFSNGKQEDDRKPDAHGLAIKLFEVPAPKPFSHAPDAQTHDIVLVDNPVFFIKNAIHYADFSEAFLAALGKGPLGTLFTLLIRYFWKHLGELRVLLGFMSKRTLDPSQVSYWSTTPYALGSVAIQYKLRPAGPSSTPTDYHDKDQLRRALAARLNSSEVRFELLAVPQADPARMLVEDPTQPWDVPGNTPVRLAVLHLPTQDFNRPERFAAGQGLSFTPWHCLEAHRPLGGINRTRRIVYRAMADARRESSDEPLREPSVTLWHDWSGLDAPPRAVT